MQPSQLNDTQSGDIATNLQGMSGMDSGGLSGFIILPLILYVILLIILLMGIWKMFEKGGIPGILGLVFLTPIFFCILGYGSAEYSGPTEPRIGS